jgi:opacity protein-like surface antigen
MKVIRSLAIYTISFLVLSPLAMASSARADGGDLAQVLQALRTLESRVATLESENQQYRRDAASARAEAQALKQKFVRQPGPNIPPQRPPSGSYAMVTKAPVPAIPPTWGGFYAGASFGLTSQHANQDGVASAASESTFVQPNFSSTSSTLQTLTSSFGGRGLGAIGKLYLGYNYMLLSNFLVGAEIEGGISNTRTTMNGTVSGPVQSPSTSTQFGVTTTTTSTGTTTGNAILNLDNRWAMSALVRGGLVVDPKDLIYLVGGLTYGRFELLDESFGAFGGTVGAGWERKITPSWTLKAEYRYTRFQDRTVTENSNQTTSVSGTTTSSSTSLATSQSSRISGLDWHTVSIGVSHYFDAN